MAAENGDVDVCARACTLNTEGMDVTISSAFKAIVDGAR